MRFFGQKSAKKENLGKSKGNGFSGFALASAEWWEFSNFRFFGRVPKSGGIEGGVPATAERTKTKYRDPSLCEG
jgi:hypothetical protein